MLAHEDRKDIYDALNRAAAAMEDIDDPKHYSKDDLKKIKQTAARYRKLAVQIGKQTVKPPKTRFLLDSSLPDDFPRSGVVGTSTDVKYKLRDGMRCRECTQLFLDGDVALRAFHGANEFRHEDCPV